MCEDVCTCASVKSECVKTGKMRQPRHERQSKPLKTINFLRENKEILKFANPSTMQKAKESKVEKDQWASFLKKNPKFEYLSTNKVQSCVRNDTKSTFCLQY